MTPFETAIRALGNTPEQVAAKLREMGIKGYRRYASRCPVANYLKACGFPVVTVATFANRYQSSADEVADEAVYLPVCVRDWIIEFDDGKHPEFYQE